MAVIQDKMISIDFFYIKPQKSDWALKLINLYRLKEAITRGSLSLFNIALGKYNDLVIFALLISET
jgi:hypothetical protein